MRQNRFKPVQTGKNRFKPGKTQEKSAPSAVVTGYINRAATTIAITTVRRSLQSTSIQHHSHAATHRSISTEHFDSTPQPRSSTSRCRDGSCTPSFVLRYLHTYFGASPATMKYTCSKCNKVFARNYHMLRHIRTVCNSSTVSPPAVCIKCGKVFARNDNLSRHERTTCVVSTPLPKRAKREDTIPRHPFISEDPIHPPD